MRKHIYVYIQKCIYKWSSTADRLMHIENIKYILLSVNAVGDAENIRFHWVS